MPRLRKRRRSLPLIKQIRFCYSFQHFENQRERCQVDQQQNDNIFFHLSTLSVISNTTSDFPCIFSSAVRNPLTTPTHESVTSTLSPRTQNPADDLEIQISARCASFTFIMIVYL